VQAEFLAMVAADLRDQHPNGGGSVVGIPRFDFEGQWSPLGRGEAQVFSMGTGLREVEPIAFQPNQ